MNSLNAQIVENNPTVELDATIKPSHRGFFQNAYETTIYYSSKYKTYTNLGRFVILLTKAANILLPINSYDNNTGNDKTLTTQSFDPFGPIYFYNTTVTKNSNNFLDNNVLYTQTHSMNLSYSFNTSELLVQSLPVYIVAALDPITGLATLSNSNPISQTLPLTDDGYIYIYLGMAINENNIQLSLTHPIYRYYYGSARLYENTFPSTFISATQPANAKPGDTWFQITE